MSTKNDFFKFYRIFRVTNLLDEDLKGLKKINNLINKFRQTSKDNYFDEAINLLKIANNIFVIDKKFIKAIKERFIDNDNYTIFNRIVKQSKVLL